jgi:hypothetical protein
VRLSTATMRPNRLVTPSIRIAGFGHTGADASGSRAETVERF